MMRALTYRAYKLLHQFWLENRINWELIDNEIKKKIVYSIYSIPSHDRLKAKLRHYKREKKDWSFDYKDDVIE
jgi:hypothetical protein